MYDSGLVSGIKRRSNLNNNVQCDTSSLLLGSDPVPQGFTLDKLARDELCSSLCGVNFSDLVDGDDVWMVERRSGFCFSHKPLKPVRVPRKPSGQHFKRDTSFKPCIPRQ